MWHNIIIMIKKLILPILMALCLKPAFAGNPDINCPDNGSVRNCNEEFVHPRWFEDRPVKFDKDLEEYEDDLRFIIDAFNDISPNFKLIFDGFTSEDLTVQNRLQFFSANYILVTHADFIGNDGLTLVFNIGDKIILANPLVQGKLEGDRLISTIFHELLHAVGLDHSFAPGIARPLMEVSGQLGFPKLTKDDINAVKDIYGDHEGPTITVRLVEGIDRTDAKSMNISLFNLKNNDFSLFKAINRELRGNGTATFKSVEPGKYIIQVNNLPRGISSVDLFSAPSATGTYYMCVKNKLLRLCKNRKNAKKFTVKPDTDREIEIIIQNRFLDVVNIDDGAVGL